MFALTSLQQYQETRSPVSITFPKLFVCGSEGSTGFPNTRGLSHLQMFIGWRGLSNICPINERKAAHHSQRGKHLLLWCGHISCNCEMWRVIMGSRKITSYKRSHALSSWMPQTLYIRMSPRMWFEMNPCIPSRSNNKCRFITDVGIFALAVAFPNPLWVPFGAVAGSW